MAASCSESTIGAFIGVAFQYVPGLLSWGKPPVWGLLFVGQRAQKMTLQLVTPSTLFVPIVLLPSAGDDIRKLEAGVHIVSGTPGRVFDMIKRRSLRTRNIKVWRVPCVREFFPRHMIVYLDLQSSPDAAPF